MKILAVSHPCVTDVNQQFYAELEQLGHEVELIVPSNFRTSYLPNISQVQRWTTFKGEIHALPVGLSASIPLHFYRSSLEKIIQRTKPDLLFVEEEPYSASAWQAFYASRKWNMKRVIYSAQNLKKVYPPPFRWMENYVMRRADMSVVVSEQVEHVMRQKGFKGPILPFPLGVDTHQFQPLEKIRFSKRKELKLEDAFVVGYVGRFVEEKGIETLLASVSLTNKQVKFLFVGNGPLLGKIQELQQVYPERVLIADQVKHKDVQLWMNAMDVLALPSITMPNWKEQFGRVIIEAMACQVPVIGSDSGEIPVLLKETGGGWTFKEKQAQELVAIITRLAADKEELSSKAIIGYQKVMARYSKTVQAKSFSEHSEKLLFTESSTVPVLAH